MTTSQITLTASEITLLTTATQTQVKTVLEHFAKIRACFGDSGEFKAEMQAVAEQIGSRNEHRYGRVYPRDKFSLAGGIEGNLLENVFYKLGLKYEDDDLPTDIVRKASHAVVMRQAMAADPELGLFIRSLVAGACRHSEIHGVELRIDLEMLEMLGLEPVYLFHRQRSS